MIDISTVDSPPSASLVINELDEDTAYVRVWRVWAGREQRVRGDSSAQVVDGVVVVDDFDIPLGYDVTYRVQAFDASNAEVDSATTEDVINVAIEEGQMWLSDPLVPESAMLVDLHGTTDPKRSYKVGDVSYPQIIGRYVPTQIGGMRSAAQGLQFVITAANFEESTAIENMIKAGGVLLCRPSATAYRHLFGLIYLSAPDIDEETLYEEVYDRHRAQWTLQGREVRPPGVAVVAPPRDWSDVYNENESYQDIYDKYDDYLGLLRGTTGGFFARGTGGE